MTEIVASKHRRSLFQPCISVSTAIVLHGAAMARRFDWALVSGSMRFKQNVIGVCGSLTTSRLIFSSRNAISRTDVSAQCMFVLIKIYLVYLET